MPFQEDSIYNPPGVGWRVLVMRRWPRGVRKDRIHEWFPDAAPSVDLLITYQDGWLDFEAFARRYKAEVRTREGVLEHLRDLEAHTARWCFSAGSAHRNPVTGTCSFGF